MYIATAIYPLPQDHTPLSPSFPLERHNVRSATVHQRPERGSCGLHQTVQDSLHLRSDAHPATGNVILRVPQPTVPHRVDLHALCFCGGLRGALRPGEDRQGQDTGVRGFHRDHSARIFLVHLRISAARCVVTVLRNISRTDYMRDRLIGLACLVTNSRDLSSWL